MRRKTITALLLFTIIVLVAAPSVTVSAKPQGFLSTKGTWIVDEKDQIVLLRGVNYPGYDAQEPNGGIRLHRENAYRTLARMGLNVVRLPISWAMLEPEPGAFNIRYLKWYVDRDVQWAKKYGLYIVLDMHQYYWADKFGGSGVPGWIVKGYSSNKEGMQQAISDFWANSSLQDHLLQTWRKIAQYYATESTIAGYDILNEPWIYTCVYPELNGAHVDAFYTNGIATIRSVDSKHIIFLEPANMNTYKLPIRENIVWSPHFYPLAFASQYNPENIKVLEADLAAKYRKFVVEIGTPMWIGEFGAFMKDNSRLEWLQDAVTLFEKYQVGWAWWAFDGKGGFTKTPSPLLVLATSISS